MDNAFWKSRARAVARFTLGACALGAPGYLGHGVDDNGVSQLSVSVEVPTAVGPNIRGPRTPPSHTATAHVSTQTGSNTAAVTPQTTTAAVQQTFVAGPHTVTTTLVHQTGPTVPPPSQQHFPSTKIYQSGTVLQNPTGAVTVNPGTVKMGGANAGTVHPDAASVSPGACAVTVSPGTCAARSSIKPVSGSDEPDIADALLCALAMKRLGNTFAKSDDANRWEALRRMKRMRLRNHLFRKPINSRNAAAYSFPEWAEISEVDCKTDSQGAITSISFRMTAPAMSPVVDGMDAYAGVVLAAKPSMYLDEDPDATCPVELSKIRYFVVKHDSVRRGKMNFIIEGFAYREDAKDFAMRVRREGSAAKPGRSGEAWGIPKRTSDDRWVVRYSRISRDWGKLRIESEKKYFVSQQQSLAFSNDLWDMKILCCVPFRTPSPTAALLAFRREHSENRARQFFGVISELLFTAANGPQGNTLDTLVRIESQHRSGADAKQSAKRHRSFVRELAFSHVPAPPSLIKFPDNLPNHISISELRALPSKDVAAVFSGMFPTDPLGVTTRRNFRSKRILSELLRPKRVMSQMGRDLLRQRLALASTPTTVARHWERWYQLVKTQQRADKQNRN